MKLYRHYKNKPYKFIGEARHSETLEEVVIYETLYENNLGKLWVRPKTMFLEDIQIDGKSMPRFKSIPLIIEQTTHITDSHIEVMAPIIKEVFGDWDSDKFKSRLKKLQKSHLLTALVDQQVVGFKLGYEQNGQEFYSWLGGVSAKFRGLGIASELMRSQHDWCHKQGYQKIKTKTKNRFREMFILNLKHGFEVIACQTSQTGDLKIILEKTLTSILKT